MLDIVATDEHQLPLPVDRKRVDDAKTRLTRTPPWDAQSVGEDAAIHNKGDERHKRDGGDRQRDLGETALPRPKIP
jgi:hypothetical protein